MRPLCQLQQTDTFLNVARIGVLVRHNVAHDAPLLGPESAAFRSKKSLSIRPSSLSMYIDAILAPPVFGLQFADRLVVETLFIGMAFTKGPRNPRQDVWSKRDPVQ